MSLLLLGLAVLARPPHSAPQSPPDGARIRIVPQYSAGFVQDIEESKDGTRLLTHDKGYAPRLWDAKRQTMLTVLDGHPDAVDLVEFSQDGTQILTRSARRVCLWDSQRAKVTASYDIAAGENATAAALSPDGRWLAIGTDRGTVTLYAGKEAHKLGTHTKAVRSLAFSPDNARLASGSDDATGRFWDIKTDKPLTAITGHKGAIRWFDFSPRGELLATSLDNTASLWGPGGQSMAVYPHTIGERGVANVGMAAVFVGKDLTEVAACEKDGTINLYKPGSTTPSRALKGHTESIRELRKSPNGHWVATYANDETLRIWDVYAGKEIPFDPEGDSPTAGAFSPTRDVWWLGYYGGEVQQFDVATGESIEQTLGAVIPFDYGNLQGQNSMLYVQSSQPSAGGGFGGSPREHLLIDPLATAKPLAFTLGTEDWTISPDGRYMSAITRSGEDHFVMFDTTTGTYVLTSEKFLDAAYSSDGAQAAVMDGDTGNIGIYNLKQRKFTVSWQWDVDKKYGGIEGPVWHPNGEWLVTFHHPDNEILMWEAATGKAVRSLGKFSDLFQSAWFADDGKTLVVAGVDTMIGIDTETGNEKWHSARVKIDNATMTPSADGSRAVYQSHTDDNKFVSRVIESATGKVLLEVPDAQEIAVSPDGKRALTSSELTATLWDIDAKKPLRSLHHASTVVNVAFGPDGKRLLTTDKLEGVHVWSDTGESRAHFVAMRDGSWLAYDDQGRYDASDPSDVAGAQFILEWEGGLEPVAMPQLKGQFYEPNLLAKALGLDKEPLRDVPSLDSLRLYPEVSVTPGEGTLYKINAKERDNGGIGTLRVSINGKEVLKRKGTGFLQFDLEPYKSFLLPEARLEEGQSNRLSVTVTNESGDLTSPPQTVNVPVPANLKTPDVHLYALCVGIGDYAGSANDLKAPPSDAESIAKALAEVSGRLLPGKTDIEVMTTAGGDKRPTRDNILNWLKETAAKASSSDIVFLFVAGHGTNRIGEGAGYYMLTPEADPGDVTAATAKTGAISGEELRVALAAIPAGKQVVVLDTCHSGAATSSLLGANRSVSGEYARAYEAIKDTTGTWLLAGAAADQVSYESANVDHGMLTYSLLEGVNQASPDALRKTPSGEMFVDIERWLSYAANRVESLKNEVGIKGVQRPEFKRAARGETFDIGVMEEQRKGFLDLKAPLPIVIVGDFEQDQEDPIDLETAVASAMGDTKTLKPWFDVAKHPGVYRMTGEYTVDGENVKVRLILQAFDERQQRRNLETVELTGTKSKLAELAGQIRTAVESRIKALETAAKEKAAQEKGAKEKAADE